jgi:hypothetical protein
MRIAIFAAIIFLAGIGPGLVKSSGPVPDSQRVHRSAMAEAHPVLVKVAGVFRLQL